MRAPKLAQNDAGRGPPRHIFSTVLGDDAHIVVIGAWVRGPQLKSMLRHSAMVAKTSSRIFVRTSGSNRSGVTRTMAPGMSRHDQTIGSAVSGTGTLTAPRQKGGSVHGWAPRARSDFPPGLARADRAGRSGVEAALSLLLPDFKRQNVISCLGLGVIAGAIFR